uniref:Protein EVI2A n=1 Tax=Leptobrachium leishanense TaxID=445787 RepID=A0A8C5PIH4_9ANUR
GKHKDRYVESGPHILYLAVITGIMILFSCQAQTKTTQLFLSNNYTTSTKDASMDSTISRQTKSQEMPPVTKTDLRSSLPTGITGTETLASEVTPSGKLSCNIEKYKTGIMICIVIIAVLVLVCAILVIFLVVLANKVASLKKKLATSKRQVRSNGDFLNASSTLWPSTLDTWQRKTQAANRVS